LTLRDGDVHLETSWWYDSGTLKFLVPTSAAPSGTQSKDWYVELSGAYGDPAEVPQALTVLPVPPPSISKFTPVKGPPFTQIDIDGWNFVNVQSVNVGPYPVVFTNVNETHLIAITHSGITPGDYTINVTTATGCAVTTGAVDSCNQSQTATTPTLFTALPLKLIPIYNKSVFEWVSVNVNISKSNGGDSANVTAKVKMKNPTWSVVNTTTQGQTKIPTDFIPDQVSNSNNAPVDIANKMNCAATATQPIFLLSSGVVKLNQYDSSVFTMRFYLELTVKKGTALNSPLETYRVITNDVNQYFIVSPNSPTTEVSDHAYEWSCNQ
jgi:hypothetical protein